MGRALARRVRDARLLNGVVVNYSTLAAADGLVVPVIVGIGYETPWRPVEAVLHLA